MFTHVEAGRPKALECPTQVQQRQDLGRHDRNRLDHSAEDPDPIPESTFDGPQLPGLQLVLLEPVVARQSDKV